MAEIRQARIKVRDRQVNGGSIPGDALFGEPFVNLYNGVLRFSGVTGGDYEASTQSGVFEVGSSLYNQKITNRLNINNNFIISGGTGLISTYGGTSGVGLSGKFLSGTTNGFVVADIADIAATTDSYTTGATWVPNTLTLKLNQGRPDVTVSIGTFTSLSATTLSGGTILSGGTNLYSIFQKIGDVDGVANVNAGTNITTGGTATSPIINLSDSPSVNNITFSGSAIGGNVQAASGTFTSLGATTLNGGTILSGGTNLYSIFQKIGDVDGVANVNAGTNITTGGTATSPIINVANSPVFTGLVSATGFTDSSLTAGRVVYVGASGRLVDEAGFEYDAAANLLKAGTIQVGTPGTTGTTATIYGDVLVIGQAISGFTSELYIEDNLIELNYNPTASTASTSLGAGWSIQDGSGSAGTDVIWDIRGAVTGLANRSFTTNLGNIRVSESGTVSSPNGLFVIKESDVIDGGVY